MSESSLLSKVAESLRPVSRDVFNGKEKLCLSTLYLQKLNAAFDEHAPEDLASSFHKTDNKANLQRDLQFLLDLICGTLALKVTPDLIETGVTEAAINLRRFESLKALSIHKVDINHIVGIQKLRSQLHELTSSRNLDCLRDILDRCGGDMSQGSLWSELRKANFSHNRIYELDNSLESTPWLMTLDLSHNQLTSVDFINNLTNLKHLNISFNKLDKVPKFKGQICKRLQVLILSNNFIEDLSGLMTLSALLQLDLSRNCIVEHNVLSSIAHLPSLHFLNLQGNPINFHPHHRNITCQYLNKNTATLNFILDNVPLNKVEKSFAGYHHPLAQSSLGSSNNSSLNSLETSVQDRTKKVRNVTIEDGQNIVVKTKNTPVATTPKVSTSHLEMKKQVEQLRQEYGDSWLYRHSGVIFQDVLGFEKSTVLSSTPSETNPSEMCFPKNSELLDSSTILYETAKDEPQESVSKDNFETAEENDFFLTSLQDEADEEHPPSDSDDAVEGEMFYVSTSAGEGSNLCVIITEDCLSERDGVSVKEQARWNLNTVRSCQKGSLPNEVQITFHTLRTDRKSRTYFVEDQERFVAMLQAKIEKAPEERISYQCMKCNEFFSRTKLKDRKDVDDDITCPKCRSIHIIENKRESL